MNFFNIVQELIEVEDTCESDIFNEKLANLQKFIGVESGDVAGMFFSDVLWHTLTPNEKNRIISDYISCEIQFFQETN